MAHNPASISARRLRAVVFWSVLLISASIGGMRPSIAQSLPAHASLHLKTSPAVPGRHGLTRTQSGEAPRWSELTPAQQQALAPLAQEWDKLEGFRKKKWLAIGNRFASMMPDEQQRLQERMRDWIKLTPEQRRLARESFARTSKLNRNQKSTQWRKYQQLSDAQKKKLAADPALSRKHVATLPTPTAQAKNHKTIPPIKSAPKRVLERSVTPQAANHSAIQSPPPAENPSLAN